MDAFINHLREALNNPDLTIRAEDSLRDLPNWDSLAILTVLSMVDEEYGVTLSGAELQNCERVADLYTLVEQRSGNA